MCSQPSHYQITLHLQQPPETPVIATGYITDPNYITCATHHKHQDTALKPHHDLKLKSPI